MINIQSRDHAGVCQHPTKACLPHTVCAHKSYAIPVLAIDLLPAAAPAGFWSQAEPLPEPDYLLYMTWKDWVGGVLIMMVLGFIYGVTK